MKRRSYLAGALGGSFAALAGCAELGVDSRTQTGDGGDGTPTDRPTESPTETPSDDPFDGWADVVDLETAPRTYALSPTSYRDDGGVVTVEFVETATAESPATARATLTNEAEFANAFRPRWLPPFGRHTSTHPREPGSTARHGREYTYRAALVFAPAEDNPLVDDPPGVERDADGLWRADEVTDWRPDPIRLDPGESVAADYHLVGHPDGAGDGRPTGVYEFSRGGNGPIRIAVWDADRPGPDADSAFAGETVPALPREGSTAWYHEADPTTATYVEPNTERTDLPAAVSFTFVNHAREGSGCGHWNLYKLVDGAGAGGETASGGRWYHLGPNVHTADCRHVGPGGAKRVTLRAFHDEGLGCGSCGCGREFTFDHLGGGRYAMVAGYGHATDYSAAMVAVDAPAVEVTPTDDADSERDGATVVVTTDRAGGGDQADPATVEVARADDADDRLIAEQVMQRRGLRNALPFFESGVETVVVHTDERVARRAAGFGDEPRRFRFDGTTYEARPVEAA